MNTLFSTTEFVGQMEYQMHGEKKHKSVSHKSEKWVEWFKKHNTHK